MGLKSKVKARVLHKLAPRSLKQGSFTYTNAVRFVDTLGTMYHQRGPQADGTFTGAEAYQMFITPVMHALNGVESVYAIICDAQDGVPWQKHKEQAARREDNVAYQMNLELEHPGFVAYPDESTIGEHGLTRPVDVRDVMPPAPERFIMDEVLKNTKLRKKMLHYFCERMMDDLIVPEGKSVRYVYDSHGSYRFESDNKSTFELAHMLHGEYDITATRWACDYKNHPIIFETADGDTIPLVVALLATQKFNGPVVWIDSRTTYVDCHDMVRTVLAATGLSYDRWILGCILCGTDFVKKGWIAAQFNDGAVFAAMRMKGMDEMGDVKWMTSTSVESLQTLVRWLHTGRLDPNLKELKKNERNAKAAETRRRNRQLKMDEQAESNGLIIMEEDATVAASSSTITVSRKRKATAESESESDSQPPLPFPKIAKLETPPLTASEAAAEAVQTEFDLKVLHMNGKLRPLSLEQCAFELGKKFAIPSQHDLLQAQPLIQFNVWYWTQAWRTDKATFEEWVNQQASSATASTSSNSSTAVN